MDRQTRNATLLLLLGGAFWGLYWIPMRRIEEAGVSAAWVPFGVYGIAFAILLPFGVRNFARIRARSRDLMRVGFCAGLALVLYTASLLETDVVRAVLLFYLTPIWGTLLGRLVLGEPLTLARAAAIVLGLSGAAIVLGVSAESLIPWPSNVGDWMALGSGLAWAFASLFLFQMRAVPMSDQLVAITLGCFVVSLALMFINPSAAPTLPKAPAVFWVLVAALYTLPMLHMTLWPATVLSPGRVGILLMGEIVVGVASAALLAGERFGTAEAVGTALILAATCSEIFGPRSR